MTTVGSHRSSSSSSSSSSKPARRKRARPSSGPSQDATSRPSLPPPPPSRLTSRPPIRPQHSQLFTTEERDTYRWHQFPLTAEQLMKPNRSTNKTCSSSQRKRVDNVLSEQALSELFSHLHPDFFYSVLPFQSLSRALQQAARVELHYERPDQPVMISIFHGPKHRPDQQRISQVLVVCPYTTTTPTHTTPTHTSTQTTTLPSVPTAHPLT
jgi:hypothetical protein